MAPIARRRERSHGLRQRGGVASFAAMRPHFLAFRRTLPGGMIVLVSLEIDNEGVVHGTLQVERRLDPTRQLFATAPVVARTSGASKDEVLKKLRTLAENDAELAREIAAWDAAHPSHRGPGERYQP
jgi:hypothetical protein